MAGYGRADLAYAAAAAAQAPGPGDGGPAYRLHDGGIDVLVDQRWAAVNPESAAHAGRLAAGAGILNARLALAVRGRPPLVRLRPHRDEPDLLARLRPGPARAPTQVEQNLLAAVPRCSVLPVPFGPAPVPIEVRRRLAGVAGAEHGWLDFITGRSAVAAVTQMAVAAHQVLAGAHSRVRPTGPEQGSVVSSHPVPGRDPCPALPGRPNGAWSARGFVPAGGGQLECDPLAVVLGSPMDTPTDDLRAGQALQRVLLTVADVHLAAYLLPQVIDVPAAREQLRLALGRSGTPQMVLRVGYAGPACEPPAATAVADPTRTSREDRSKVP
ncbi:nitroreductase [Micromonospora sp. NPDC023737]|uniref:nitroreductase n=1 Tax=unclassified Micromonospora TaxID=2617518 RepID=UPI003405F384